MADEAVKRVDTPTQAPETLPSLVDSLPEPAGTWPVGWYTAEIISGYRAGAYVFETSDTLSKAGDSRNLMIAVHVMATKARSDDDGNHVTPSATRDIFTNLNYRVSDFEPATIAAVRAGGGEKRTRAALGNLRQLEKAVGLTFKRHPEGHILAGPLVGHKVDVRLTIGEKGYNDVTGFAPVGTKSGK